MLHLRYIAKEWENHPDIIEFRQEWEKLDVERLKNLERLKKNRIRELRQMAKELNFPLPDIAESIRIFSIPKERHYLKIIREILEKKA